MWEISIKVMLKNRFSIKDALLKTDIYIISKWKTGEGILS